MGGLEIEIELENEGFQQAPDVEDGIEAAGSAEASDTAAPATQSVPTTLGIARG